MRNLFANLQEPELFLKNIRIVYGKEEVCEERYKCVGTRFCTSRHVVKEFRLSRDIESGVEGIDGFMKRAGQQPLPEECSTDLPNHGDDHLLGLFHTLGHQRFTLNTRRLYSTNHLKVARNIKNCNAWPWSFSKSSLKLRYQIPMPEWIWKRYSIPSSWPGLKPSTERRALMLRGWSKEQAR